MSAQKASADGSQLNASASCWPPTYARTAVFDMEHRNFLSHRVHPLHRNRPSAQIEYTNLCRRGAPYSQGIIIYKSQ